MLKALILPCLLLLSAPVLAEWRKIASGFNPTAYADIDTITRNGDIATMWVLIDFKKAPFDGNNLPYLSLKMKSEYNCAASQFRFIDLTSYSGHMATGRKPYTSIEPGAWKAVVGDGIQKPLWDVACKQ
jgi:hypothetical protein